MKETLFQLGSDFLSALVFFVLYLVSGNVILGTSVAVAVAIAQVVYAHIKGRPLGFMTYASLGLVVVLGTVTLLTNDPRFMFAKPAIAHFAVGTIMLKRGWMLRYVPPIVTDNIPGAVIVAGYAWAALMFTLGLGTIAVAMAGDVKLWAFYISFVAVGAKLAAFAIQYVTFRTLVTQRIRAARA
jgi:intracellular septation protein